MKFWEFPPNVKIGKHGFTVILENFSFHSLDSENYSLPVLYPSLSFCDENFAFDQGLRERNKSFNFGPTGSDSQKNFLPRNTCFPEKFEKVLDQWVPEYTNALLL